MRKYLLMSSATVVIGAVRVKKILKRQQKLNEFEKSAKKGSEFENVLTSYCAQGPGKVVQQQKNIKILSHWGLP